MVSQNRIFSKYFNIFFFKKLTPAIVRLPGTTGRSAQFKKVKKKKKKFRKENVATDPETRRHQRNHCFPRKYFVMKRKERVRWPLSPLVGGGGQWRASPARHVTDGPRCPKKKTIKKKQKKKRTAIVDSSAAIFFVLHSRPVD